MIKYLLKSHVVVQFCENGRFCEVSAVMFFVIKYHVSNHCFVF